MGNTTSTTRPVAAVYAPPQEVRDDRAALEKLIDSLDAHPDLLQRLRLVLEVPPLQRSREK